MDNFGFVADSDDGSEFEENLEIPEISQLCLNPYQWIFFD